MGPQTTLSGVSRLVSICISQFHGVVGDVESAEKKTCYEEKNKKTYNSLIDLFNRKYVMKPDNKNIVTRGSFGI